MTGDVMGAVDTYLGRVSDPCGWQVSRPLTGGDGGVLNPGYARPLPEGTAGGGRGRREGEEGG